MIKINQLPTREVGEITYFPAQQPLSAYLNIAKVVTRTNALQLLKDLANTAKASNKQRFKLKSRYNDRNASSLVECVVDWFILNGHFATRRFGARALKSYGNGKQATEYFDVFACLHDQFVCVKIKQGLQLPPCQLAEITQAMIKTSALVYMARDFQGFYEWYMTYVPILPTDKTSPAFYHQRHPIPRLATPDLF